MKNKEYEMAIKIAGEVESSFRSSMALAQRELKKYQKELKASEPIFNDLKIAGSATFQALKKGAEIAAVAIGGIGTASIAVGAEFEKQMSTVRAISGASQKEYEELNDMAKELGRTTQFTASEAGSAMEYMAMAGWKTEDMLAGLPGLLDLSAASGEDLAATSDIVTDAMTAFGMGADEVERFSDVLAAATSDSNTTVAGMGESFKYVGSIAGALKYDVEDVSLALGLMANQGIKGSQSGTSLRKIMSNMRKDTKVASEALGEYVIQTTNADGSMRKYSDVIKDMRYAFAQMTDTEKAANAEAIAGKTGMAGLLAIVNTSEKDYKKLEKAIRNSKGAAEEMSRIRQDNLAGDFERLKSAVSGTGIEIYEELNEPLREATQWATELVGEFAQDMLDSGWLEDAVKKIPTAARKIKELAKEVGEFAEPFLSVGGWLVEHPDIIVGTIAGIGTSLATYKVATGITSLATSLTSLGPAGAVVLGLGGVAGIITGIGSAIYRSAEEAKQANLDRHFGDITLSMKELEQTARYIIDDGSLDGLNATMNQMAELDGIQQTIDESVEALNKLDWKVSIGMKLSKEERKTYRQTIKDFKKEVQSYVENERYTVTMAVSVLSDGDEDGNNIISELDMFYQGKQDELKDIGKKLNKTVTEAFSDGLLDIDEAKEITELRQQMASIQEELATSDFESKLDVLSLEYDGELDADSFKNLQDEIGAQADEAAEYYKEAYGMSMNAIRNMFEDGKYTKAEFERASDIEKENYYGKIANIETGGLDFQTGKIKDLYYGEISETMTKFRKHMQNEFYSNAEAWRNAPTDMFRQMSEDLKSYDLSDGAIKELWEQLEPSVEEVRNLAKKYEEAGWEIPESIRKSLTDASELGALAGDEESLWYYMSANAGNEGYQGLIEIMENNGYEIPQAIEDGMERNKPSLDRAAKNTYDEFGDLLNNYFLNDYYIQPRIIWEDTIPRVNSRYDMEELTGKLPGHADGGIFTKPHIAAFAEDGMEAAIPINRSERARKLYEKTGELLGIKPLEVAPVQQETSITYAPKLEFYGGAPSKQDLTDAMQMSQDRFEEMFERMMRRKSRTSF